MNLLNKIKKLPREHVAAIEQIIDYGPHYFNPLLGSTDAVTFTNISDVMQLVHDLLQKYDDIEEITPGIKLVVQMVWGAAQFKGMFDGPQNVEAKDGTE